MFSSLAPHPFRTRVTDGGGDSTTMYYPEHVDLGETTRYISIQFSTKKGEEILAASTR
jgi:hypothetical protein